MGYSLQKLLFVCFSLVTHSLQWNAMTCKKIDYIYSQVIVILFLVLCPCFAADCFQIRTLEDCYVSETEILTPIVVHCIYVSVMFLYEPSHLNL